MEGEQGKIGNSIPKKVEYPNPPDPYNPDAAILREQGKIGNSIPKKVEFPNPPDPYNPDAATLREQWKFAMRQYSKWYSHAWGTAILAGCSFFALGWYIKGGNPLVRSSTEDKPPDKQPRSSTS